jgi:hypothetical protein
MLGAVKLLFSYLARDAGPRAQVNDYGHRLATAALLTRIATAYVNCRRFDEKPSIAFCGPGLRWIIPPQGVWLNKQSPSIVTQSISIGLPVSSTKYWMMRAEISSFR